MRVVRSVTWPASGRAGSNPDTPTSIVSTTHGKIFVSFGVPTDVIELWTYPGTTAAAGTESVVSELVERGVDGVSVSAHHHSARIVPPRERSVVRWAGGCWFEPDADRFGRIEPPVIERAASDLADPLATTAGAARDAGVAVSAWTVIGHGSRLGATNPAYRIRDAFGTPHDHALCFSHPAVRTYFARLAAAVGDRPVDALDPESVRQLSVFHGHDAVVGHEASPLPAGEVARRLYSQCFCDACRRAAVEGVGEPPAAGAVPTGVPSGFPDGGRFTAVGGTGGVFVDRDAFDAARERVQTVLAEPLADPSARLPPLAELVRAEPALAALFRFRMRQVGATLAAIAEGSPVPVDVQVRGAQPNRWQGRRLADLDRHADRLTVRCYGVEPDEARDRVERLRRETDVTLNAAVRFDSFDDGDRFVEVVEALRGAVDRAVRVFSYPTAGETQLDWLERVTT